MKAISFSYQTAFELDNPTQIKKWMSACLDNLGYVPKQISVAFMDDEALLRINTDYLKHHYYTDVITFDYSVGNDISCDIAISVDRVAENAPLHNTSFEEELHRVIIHGLLHCCGYGDKTEDEARNMRHKEDEFLTMFHVEPNTHRHV